MPNKCNRQTLGFLLPLAAVGFKIQVSFKSFKSRQLIYFTVIMSLIWEVDIIFQIVTFLFQVFVKTLQCLVETSRLEDNINYFNYFQVSQY